MRFPEKIKEKIFLADALTQQCEKWKNQGSSLVFTNGCFDILHKGHLEILCHAAGLGDKLIVALNTDASVRRLKGDQRPVNDESFRSYMMASLEIVDAVVLFDEPTPADLIRKLTPNVLVKGGDYQADQVVGADHVLQQGGQVCIVPFVTGYSTTGLIEKIRQL
jgi:D-glycero-beta-D-manno-heptose 1-phosphate adenylyltransferase